jgi:7SK snRNA methylphosphate capping enzyme
MLTYRPDDFSRILLEEIGFQRMDLLEPAGDSGFERPLQVYTKAGGSWFRD